MQACCRAAIQRARFAPPAPSRYPRVGSAAGGGWRCGISRRTWWTRCARGGCRVVVRAGAPRALATALRVAMAW